MLLRSVSTPALESLLASHTLEPLQEAKNESQDTKCVSLTSRGSNSSLITCNYNTHLQKGWGSCDAHGLCPPSTGRVRRVLSENDLSSLGAPFPPARSIAAHSLLHDDSARTEHLLCSNVDLDNSRSLHARKGPRTSMSPFNWRRLSLGSLPSELPSLSFDDGDSGGILEEVELGSSNCSTASAEEEEEEERQRRVCVFDKIALPITKAVNAKGGLANDAGFRINTDALSERTTSEINMEEVFGYGERGSVKNMERVLGHGEKGSGSMMNRETGASFSGRHDPTYMTSHGSSSKYAGREIVDTTTLVQQVFSQASRSNYEQHGDQWEMSPGAGNGGRGTRAPPTLTGGNGGGGEAGGHGGSSSDLTDLHYQITLKDNPGHPLILRNYAQYLAEVKHDYRKAEEFFQRAILANPSDGELLGQYAKMLWEVQQDRERATTYFERAVQASPDNSYVMAAYASFLWNSEEEKEEEEEEESMEEVEGSSRANVPASLVSLVSAGLA